MAMPEATMDEKGDSARRKHNVRDARKATVVQNISEAATMKIVAYQEFWPCVLVADVGHYFATFLYAKDIQRTLMLISEGKWHDGIFESA
jgi:hypothetical protein